jgi:hypothetical protein
MTTVPQWLTFNYFGGNRIPIADLPWAGTTHVLDVYAGVYGNGQVGPEIIWPGMSGYMGPLVQAAHAHGAKALLCIGALDLPNAPCWTNLYNATVANAWLAASNLVSVVNQSGYDGIALDWEPPGPMADSFGVLTTLLRALRLQLPNPKVLTCAAFARVESAGLWGANGNGSEALSYLDRLHLMAFGLVGRSVGRSFFNAALYGGSHVDEANAEMSVDSNVRMFESRGVPAEKINVVLPFFGYKLQSSSAPFALAGSPPGSPPDAEVPYNTIVNSHLPGATVYADQVARVPWAAVPGVGWFSYDDPASIRAKVDYVRQRGLGGVDAHEIGAQYFPNAAVKHPLWQAVVDGFAAPAPSGAKSLVVDVDEGSLVRWTGGTHPQQFSGRISGDNIPALLDTYIFAADRTTLERWMPNVSTAGGVWTAVPSSPVGVGSHWLYVFAPGGQILATSKFVVRDTL